MSVLHAANGTGVIVYQPMHSGLLSGAFSADRVVAAGRRLAQDHAGLHHLPGCNLAVTDALSVITRRHDVPVPAVAVASTLAWRGVTRAIALAR